MEEKSCSYDKECNDFWNHIEEISPIIEEADKCKIKTIMSDIEINKITDNLSEPQYIKIESKEHNCGRCTHKESDHNMNGKKGKAIIYKTGEICGCVLIRGCAKCKCWGYTATKKLVSKPIHDLKSISNEWKMLCREKESIGQKRYHDLNNHVI